MHHPAGRTEEFGSSKIERDGRPLRSVDEIAIADLSWHEIGSGPAGPLMDKLLENAGFRTNQPSTVTLHPLGWLDGYRLLTKPTKSCTTQIGRRKAKVMLTFVSNHCISIIGFAPEPRAMSNGINYHFDSQLRRPRYSMNTCEHRKHWNLLNSSNLEFRFTDTSSGLCQPTTVRQGGKCLKRREKNPIKLLTFRT